MNIININFARAHLFTVVENVIDTHEPVIMSSKHGNVVMLSEEDFRSIQETLNLQAISGLVDHVKEGQKKSKGNLATRNNLPW